MRPSKILPVVAVLAALWAAMQPASAAPVVILSSSEAALPPGTVIDDATAVEIPAGGVIVLNDATGKTRTLAGPFSGPIGGEATAAGDTGIATGLGKLFAARQEERSRLGAIRAAPDQVARSHERIVVTQSATQCAPAGALPILWRPETMDADSRVVIENTADGRRAELLWHEGQREIGWPQDLPPVDGGTYLVSLDLAPRPVELTLRLVPETAKTDAAEAAWMSEAGCRRQALLLLDSLIE